MGWYEEQPDCDFGVWVVEYLQDEQVYREVGNNPCTGAVAAPPVPD